MLGVALEQVNHQLCGQTSNWCVKGICSEFFEATKNLGRFRLQKKKLMGSFFWEKQQMKKEQNQKEYLHFQRKELHPPVLHRQTWKHRLG
ncbi:hypothetical protein NDU88_006288 [Pleurodeles waltl]|uniref:Uncharacterized protein n=1 Tax=Pleurodeles waltl TaxID=8319 RepID=A0AAV7MD05_PLEWA|nr:hypothetical protein NDU88_006288 [Pleurodeles waltl]